ncbi:MAG: hypothetical protein IT439_12505 [Phycisphaerales bacterium]|nr:hypothetical protein [Phycisphaerales bacterium]
MKLLSGIVAAMIGLGLGVCSGCAAAPPPADASGRPADFAVSITVISTQDDPTLISALPRQMRPARYVIEADGSLRAAVGAGATPDIRPALTRRLDSAQMARLWRLIEESGFAEPEGASRLASEAAASELYAATTAVMSVTHAGTRAASAIDLEGGGAEAEAAALIVDQIAAWAWVRP